jgi:peptidoglycan/LPS O-acetylase OafA/YrhL
MTLDTAATPGPDRIESLQIMRGLAATSVMMFHFTAANLIFREVYPSFAGALHYGFLGVEAFFVISGFVIPHAMAEAGYRLRADATTFFLRRLVRLEPAYLVSILFALVIGFVAAHAPGYRGAPFVIEPVRWLLHVAYLVPWFGRDWLNSAYWTLAIEFQYYLAMIVAAPLLIAPGRWKPRVFLLGVLALSTMFEDSRLIFYFLPFFGLGFVAFLLLHARMRIAKAAIWAMAFAAYGRRCAAISA